MYALLELAVERVDERLHLLLDPRGDRAVSRAGPRAAGCAPSLAASRRSPAGRSRRRRPRRSASCALRPRPARGARASTFLLDLRRSSGRRRSACRRATTAAAGCPRRRTRRAASRSRSPRPGRPAARSPAGRRSGSRAAAASAAARACPSAGAGATRFMRTDSRRGPGRTRRSCRRRRGGPRAARRRGRRRARPPRGSGSRRRPRRPPLAGRRHALPEPPPLAGVERGGRLVEQEHVAGSPSSAIARLSRWRLPTESVRARATLAGQLELARAAVRRRRPGRASPSSRANSSRFSRAESRAVLRRPLRRPADAHALAPLDRRRRSARARPARIASSVDLPAPFGPTSASVSPSADLEVGRLERARRAPKRRPRAAGGAAAASTRLSGCAAAARARPAAPGRDAARSDLDLDRNALPCAHDSSVDPLAEELPDRARRRRAAAARRATPGRP